MLIKDNEKKSYDYVAEKVCDGWFGNGFERRKKLEDAGYDFYAIQDIVNEKMMAKNMEEIRSKSRNMSNYRILKAMITECRGSSDISYINMILNLAETIVDDSLSKEITKWHNKYTKEKAKHDKATKKIDELKKHQKDELTWSYKRRHDNIDSLLYSYWGLKEYYQEAKCNKNEANDAKE